MIWCGNGRVRTRVERPAVGMLRAQHTARGPSMTRLASWLVPTALIAVTIVYFVFRPSPFRCTKFPDADVMKPASEVRLMPWEMHDDCRRCHTGPVAEIPPARSERELSKVISRLLIAAGDSG